MKTHFGTKGIAKLIPNPWHLIGMASFTPRPLYARGRFGERINLLLLPGSEPQTVQPIA